jgi:hypothetical protein
MNGLTGQERQELMNARAEVTAAIVEIKKIERSARDGARRVKRLGDANARLATDAERFRIDLVNLQLALDERFRTASPTADG